VPMGLRTRLLLIGGCLLLLWLSIGPADLQETLSRADEAYQAGRLAEAATLYERVSAYAGGKRMVALRLAEVKMALAQQETADPRSAYQAARDAWLDVLEFDQANRAARRALAETHLALGDVQAAEEALAQLPAGSAADASLLNQMVAAHLQQEDWAAAGRAYTRIAVAEPGNSEARFWAGALLLTTDPSLAQQHLLQARNDALYQEQAGRLLQALEQVAMIPDPIYRAAQMGLAYLDIGEPGLAEEQFLAALEAEPTYADAWAYLGTAQDQLGRNGRTAIATAIELEPDSPLAHSLMGHHWLAQQRPDLARQEFLAARDLDPDSPTHLADVALTYQMEGDTSSAEAWYQGAVRHTPDAPTFWVLLAQFYLDVLNEVADGGLLVAQKAVALDPENPAALDILGWAQFLDGQTRLAETNLLAARQRDPALPSVHYHLGRLYDDQGERDEAVRAYQLAEALDTTCQMCQAARRGPYAELAARALGARGN
jgi:tetratricopeptide (TPR) repeat protein